MGVPIVERASGIRLCAGYVGYAFIFAGAIVMVPLLTLLFFPEERVLAPCFIFPGVGAMLLGYLICFMSIKGFEKGRLKKSEDALAITASWICAVAVFALPFIATGDYTLPQAVFEATSGLTTTGLSIVDVASCSHLMLLHRSMMHFFGGVGLLLVLASLVSDNGILRIYNAEGHTDRLLPSVAGTARMILALYMGVIAVGVFAYVVCGMPLFDAVNMSISAVSTGGFAVEPASVGAYESASIEVVSIVLMMLGATNFLALYLLLKGNVKAFFHHAETKAFYGVVLAVSLVVGLVIVGDGSQDPLWRVGLDSLLHVVSVITTTGFQTVDSFAAYPSAVLLLFIMLMFLGSEAGSTAGGIKMYRIVVIVKGLFWTLRDGFGHRRNIYSRKISRFGKRIDCTDEECWAAFAYALLYLGMFVIVSFVFALAGASLEEAAFESASCLGNVGVGIGFITADSSPIVLWTASAGMLLGRLEIIPVFLGFWKMGSIARAAIFDRLSRGKEAR